MFLLLFLLFFHTLCFSVCLCVCFLIHWNIWTLIKCCCAPVAMRVCVNPLFIFYWMSWHFIIWVFCHEIHARFSLTNVSFCSRRNYLVNRVIWITFIIDLCAFWSINLSSLIKDMNMILKYLMMKEFSYLDEWIEFRHWHWIRSEDVCSPQPELHLINTFTVTSPQTFKF